KHAEVALGPRHVDLIDLAGEQELFGRDEIELEGGHVLQRMVSGEWRMERRRSLMHLFATPYSPFATRQLTPLPPRASCPSRPPLRWCRPCRRRLRGGGRICLRPAP